MHILTAILIVALVAALLVRGPRNLPSIGRMLGRGVKATKDEVKDWHADEPPPGPDSGSAGTPPPGP
jgi:Sec-independent protein translocase protein TatA